jgi:hypothetical protein
MARLRAIDLSLLDGYQDGLKALQEERRQLAAELDRLEATPDRKEQLLERVDAAMGLLDRLDAAAAGAEPDLTREVLAEVVTRIEVWFVHERHGRRTRCHFTRALVYVREDVALVYAGVLHSLK